MKSRKPKTVKQRIEYAAITIGVIIFYLIVAPIAFIPVLIYGHLVILPIVRAVETQSYYLTWYEVKRRSGKGTSSVLSVLTMYSGPDGMFDCILRDQSEVERLERRLQERCPSRAYPLHDSEAVFFRFRLRAGGTGKKRWRGSLVPRVRFPSHPAYA